MEPSGRWEASKSTFLDDIKRAQKEIYKRTIHDKDNFLYYDGVKYYAADADSMKKLMKEVNNE